MTEVNKMKAPAGVGAATIEGHEYQVPKDRIIRVVNQIHVETLKRHGFVEHYEDPDDIAIQIDQMNDKDELVTFIEERGGEAETSFSVKKLKRLAREITGVTEEA